MVYQFIEYSLAEQIGDFSRMGIAFNKIGKLYTKMGYDVKVKNPYWKMKWPVPGVQVFGSSQEPMEQPKSSREWKMLRPSGKNKERLGREGPSLFSFFPLARNIFHCLVSYREVLGRVRTFADKLQKKHSFCHEVALELCLLLFLKQ